MEQAKAKVLIEGDSQDLKEAVNDAKRSVNGLGSDIKGAFNRGVGESGALLEDLAFRGGQTMGMIKHPAVLAAAAVTAIGTAAYKVGTQALQLAADFQSSMANVSTIVDTTTVDMQEMGDGVLALSGKLGKPATELAEGLYQVISAGVPAADALSVLEVSTKAATAGLTDTFTAVDGITTVLNSYGLKASEAGRVSDLMFKTVERGKTTFPELASSIGNVAAIAASTKVPMEELFGAISTLTAGGLGTSEAITGIKAALSNVIKPSQQATELAAKLGLEFNAQSLQAKGLAGFLEEVRTKTGGNVEQMSLLFGSVEGLNAMLALTGQQSGRFAEDLAVLKDSAGATDSAFAKQNETFNRMKERVSVMAQTVMIQIGEKLLPIFERLLQWVIDNWPMISRVIDVTVKAISSAVDTNIVKPIQFAIGVFNSLRDTVVGVYNFVADKVQAVKGFLQDIGLMKGQAEKDAAATEQAKTKATGTRGKGGKFVDGVPSFHTGGVMPYTGLAFLHAGERILNPRETAALAGGGLGGNNTIYITGNTIASDYDVRRIGDILIDKLSLQGRR